MKAKLTLTEKDILNAAKLHVENLGYAHQGSQLIVQARPPTDRRDPGGYIVTVEVEVTPRQVQGR